MPVYQPSPSLSHYVDPLAASMYSGSLVCVTPWYLVAMPYYSSIKCPLLH